MSGSATAKRLLHAVAHTRHGRRALASIARADPQLVIEALGPRVNRNARFATVRRWPDHLQGFDDLAFLFSSHQLHHAIISLAIDEAAYLYDLARGTGATTIVEIGRYKGGSTLLLAAAMSSEARLYSYDLHVKQSYLYSGVELDDELRRALERFGLADRVELAVANSHTVEPPSDTCGLVFVDGDHSYAGVRADYGHWRPVIPHGGHLVFHDAGAAGDLSVPHTEIVCAVAEIERDDARYFVRHEATGTLVHFERTDEVAPWERASAADS